MKKSLLALLLLTSSNITIASSTVRVGDFREGGVVSWLDPLKDYKHGIIADVKDRPGLYSVFNVDPNTPGLPNIYPNSGGVYQGKEDTKKIIEMYGANASAAYACATSDAAGFNDWYLPSADEMWLNKVTVDHVALAHNGDKFILDGVSSYASSGYYHFGDEYRSDSFFLEKHLRVRCIRLF